MIFFVSEVQLGNFGVLLQHLSPIYLWSGWNGNSTLKPDAIFGYTRFCVICGWDKSCAVQTYFRDGSRAVDEWVHYKGRRQQRSATLIFLTITSLSLQFQRTSKHLISLRCYKQHIIIHKGKMPYIVLTLIAMCLGREILKKVTLIIYLILLQIRPDAWLGPRRRNVRFCFFISS